VELIKGEEEGDLQICISHEISFPRSSCHVKGITAIAFDKVSGSQMLTGGGGDYTLRVWDFNNMNKLLKPFKYFIPFDGHPVRSLSFSSDNDASMFLCCCGNN
jgi:WD40 repeat protein